MKWASLPLFGRLSGKTEPALPDPGPPTRFASQYMPAAEPAEPRHTDGHAQRTDQRAPRTTDAPCSTRCHDSAESVGLGCGGATHAEPLIGNTRYLKLHDVNRGACGFVQLARDTVTCDCVAVKFIPLAKGFNAQSVGRELLNQRACAGHDHIVQLREVFLTDHHLAIAMDFADGGNLSQHIDNLKGQGVYGVAEDQARMLFQQLLVALDYCHRLGVANRDIKLDNLLLHGAWPQPTLKICDFGHSKDEDDSVSKSACGTPEYMAPEVLFEDCYDGKVADVWSAGVALYVMLSGEFPFKRPNDKLVPKVVAMQRMFGRIIKAEYPVLTQISEDARELLNWMLQPDVEVRATLSEVISSAWFQKDMPPRLATLNARCAQQPATARASGDFVGGACSQSPEQLLHVVVTAARAAALLQSR